MMPVIGELLPQHISRDDFGSDLAHNLGSGSGSLAADGIEKFLARNGGSAAFHDYQAPCNVCDVCCFERRGATGERKSVCSQNGIAGAGDIHSLVAAMNGDLREAIAWLEKSRPVSSPGDQERLQFHLGKSPAACAFEFVHILADIRVMFSLKLGLVWRSRCDARLRITVQLVTRVEYDVQGTLALRGCLLDQLRSRNAKAIVGNSKRVGVAQPCRTPLMEFYADGVRQKRLRFVVDAQNLLPHGVRPAGEKAAFGRRPPAFHAQNARNIDSLAAELSDKHVSSSVITDSGDGQNARAERREVIGSIGSSTRNNPSFAMFEDQDWGFARDARDFAVLEFIGHEIAKENDCFRAELFDALTEAEKVDRR